jgi:hypothetical protein
VLLTPELIVGVAMELPLLSLVPGVAVVLEEPPVWPVPMVPLVPVPEPAASVPLDCAEAVKAANIMNKPMLRTVLFMKYSFPPLAVLPTSNP